MSLPEINNCPEFPHFGAHYPDARCINGYLWDLDKCDGDGLYGGGNDPCPFCNEKEFIEWAADIDDQKDVEKIKKYIQFLREKYK